MVRDASLTKAKQALEDMDIRWLHPDLEQLGHP